MVDNTANKPEVKLPGAAGVNVPVVPKVTNTLDAHAKVNATIKASAKPPTTPWKPAEVLKLPKKLGFRQRWVREDIVDRYLAEGWKLVEDKKKALNPPKTIVDGVPLSTTVRKRELVLMEITEALAKERDVYYKSLTDGALKGSINEFKKVANEDGAKSYGKVEISGGGGA
jgi:hypothetical protein